MRVWRIRGLLGRALLLCSLIAWAPGPAASQAIDIDKVEAGVVRVRADFGGGYSTGTGFVINNQGYIATNWHVINIQGNRSTQISIFPSGSAEQVPVEFIWETEIEDLAILRLTRSIGRAPVPLTSVLPKKGQDVYAVGFPGVAANWGSPHISSVTRGVLSRAISGNWGRGGSFPLVQHSAQINKGNSGGPLFDGCGRVIGVNTQGPMISVVRNGKQIAIPAGSGVFFSSQITVLARRLSQQGISFENQSNICELGAGRGTVTDPAARRAAAEAKKVATRAQEETEKIRTEAERARRRAESAEVRIDRIIGQLMIWGPILALLVVAAIILALRKPRERVVNAVKGYGEQISRRLSRPSDHRESRSGGPPRTGLCLAGFDMSGVPVKMNVEGGKLATRSGIVVGRHPDLTDIVLSDRGISRRHIRIRRHDRRMWLEDLNSTNGTMLNHRPLAPFKAVEIRAGDQIVLGKVELSVSRL